MKKITVVCSERGDWYWDTVEVDEGETLHEALANMGVGDFSVADVDANDSDALESGMTVWVRILG